MNWEEDDDGYEEPPWVGSNAVVYSQGEFALDVAGGERSVPP